MRRALAASLNIPAVKTLEFVGMDAMLTTAHRMGINGLRDPARYGLSVTLGGGEVTLLDLTYAYTPFANNGLQVGAPLADSDRNAGLAPVRAGRHPGDDRRGAGAGALPAASRPAAALVDPGLAYLITDILCDDEARAETFGPQQPAQALAPGSRQDRHHRRLPRLLGGRLHARSGDRRLGRQQRRQPDARRARRARAPAAIWHAFMEAALAGVPPRPFPRPAEHRRARGLQAVRPAAHARTVPDEIQELFTTEQSARPSRTTCTVASRSAR